MPPDPSFADMLERLRDHDPGAAVRIFQEFSGRLIALARSRLDGSLQRKVDPEDVAQSVFRSFFARQAEGQFDLADWQGLWAVLVIITLRKCGHQVEYYRAACRDISRERQPELTDDSLSSWQALGREPSPSEAARLTELVEHLMASLGGEKERKMLELSLQGFDVPHISNQIGRSERTVHRVLAQVRKKLERLLEGEGKP